MDPSMRMIFVAAALMLALLAAIVSTVSMDPLAMERHSLAVNAERSPTGQL